MMLMSIVIIVHSVGFLNNVKGYPETKIETLPVQENQPINDDSDVIIISRGSPDNTNGRDFPYATPAYYLASSKPYLPDRLLAAVDYFDSLSVNSHLNNKQFVETQIRCLVYDGTCDFFGRKAKELLPSIILDNCRLCTEEQKDKLYRVVVHLQQHYPGPWRDALVKYGQAPKFITAGQVVPGASFFGVHKRPPQDGPEVIHYISSSTTTEPPSTDNLIRVIPTPQAVTITHEGTSDDTVQPTKESVDSAPESSSYPNDYYQYPMTMTSTLVAPIPVLASLIATNTSPIPEQLNGAVESPPIFPTTIVLESSSQGESTNTSPNTIPPYDLSSSSSIEPPSTSVVESTLEIKPTTIEPFLLYQN